MAKRILLSDEIERRRQHSIVIEIDGQDDIIIDQPDLWSDERVSHIEAAKSDGDMMTLGKILLGDDYDRFVAAGGTSMMAFDIFKEHVGEPGESSGS